jgi:hypothetical protein
MHRTYEKDGLAVVSLDMMPGELKERTKILEFLTKQGADFPNFIFDDQQEKIDDWLARHRVVGSPTVILFDRAGKLAQVLDDVAEATVEVEARALLAAK